MSLMPAAEEQSLPTVFTIGHSTRPAADFLALLEARAIQTLMDIRTVPASRRNPQFSRESLSRTLAAAGIDYVHEARLGGLRRPRRDSPNTGWRNTSFRGYADYMQTPEFASGLDSLLAVASRSRTAIMCAEAVPWRCHRSLVADALTVRGCRVLHIVSSAAPSVHRLTPFLRVHDGVLTYPPPQPELLSTHQSC
jgi:uncharacterized protein (DUF488 family)